MKEKPMKREIRVTVTFTHPFQLKGIDRTLPPGDYTILTEEECLISRVSSSLDRDLCVEQAIRGNVHH